jgi:hypothetical protein
MGNELRLSTPVPFSLIPKGGFARAKGSKEILEIPRPGGEGFRVRAETNLFTFNIHPSKQ